MAEPPDGIALAPEHRAYVTSVHARLAELTHYQLLGVPREADDRAIKRAYFELARVIHPDRYFGKQLGEFKPKLDAIFTHASKAYQTLTDPALRAAYDATLPRPAAASTPAPGTPAVQPPVSPAAAARQKAVLEALKQRSADQQAKAAPHLEAAARARTAGDVAAAAEAYRRALGFTPHDAAVKAAYAEVEQLAAARKYDAHRRQAALAERQGRWAQAVASWKIVVAGLPDDAEARTRLAAAQAELDRSR